MASSFDPISWSTSWCPSFLHRCTLLPLRREIPLSPFFQSCANIAWVQLGNWNSGQLWLRWYPSHEQLDLWPKDSRPCLFRKPQQPPYAQLDSNCHELEPLSSQTWQRGTPYVHTSAFHWKRRSLFCGKPSLLRVKGKLPGAPRKYPSGSGPASRKYHHFS